MTKTAEECARQAWEMDIINKGGRTEWIPTLGADPKIAEVCEERDRLFNEHRVAMRLLKENTELLNASTERQIAAVEAMRVKFEAIVQSQIDAHASCTGDICYGRCAASRDILGAIGALKYSPAAETAED